LYRTASNKPVIPAKAGIQRIEKPRASGTNPSFGPLRGLYLTGFRLSPE
jgi:hypothetical protein